MFSGDKKASFDYAGGDLEAMIGAENYYRWIVDIIKPYIGNSVVEMGAGAGSFSKLLLELKPKNLSLVEPGKKMYELLNENMANSSETNVQVLNNYLEGATASLKKVKPDTFIYVNVFEHIKDDVKELTSVASLLNKNGHVIIFVPALEGLYSDFDKSIGHYRRYNKRSLARLANEAGMEIVELRYMDMPGILPWWTSFVLLHRKKLVPRLVSAYDAVFVPIIRTIENTLRVPVGKNLLMVAKKK